jgi:predicted ATPase/DNA-binding SARP family transcriptional activator
MKEIRIYCFGHLRLEVDGVSDIHFETDKMRALLVYLAVENGRPQSRSHLAGLLWSDQPEQQAMHNLRQTLLNLRKKLEEVSPEQLIILVKRDTVQINPEVNLWVDVHAFRAGLNRAYRHYQRLNGVGWLNVRWLEKALVIKQAQFLTHFDLRGSQLFEEWLLILREDLDQQAIKSLALLCEIYEQRGDFELARQAAQRLIDVFPWHETAHSRLMRLFAVDHQWGPALNQYRILTRLLKDQLGVEPARETTELFEKIRSAAVSECSEAFPVHRLNVNLPAYAAHFIGREQELDALSDLLADPACPLITLLGPGGIGKTRLALEVARQQVGVFGDGVFFVPLAAVLSAEQVFLEIASSLGLVLYDESNPILRVLGFLREKRLLLVLDNYEQLLKELHGTRPVMDILEKASGVKILVTSRERLMLREEWVFPLDGLRCPQQALPSGKPIEQILAEFDALALFDRQARQVHYNFSLDNRSLVDVVRICQMLEGLPLGIELAAAAIWRQPCRQLAEKISAHFDALMSTVSNVPPRHRSLRAAFDISWELLDESERLLFCRLSVFQGGFTMEAAQVVAEADPDILLALVNKSLIRRDASGRFDLHAVIRQYASDRLCASGCSGGSCAAHARYYGQFFSEKRVLLQGSNQKQALDDIQEEIGNAALAWSWLVENRAGNEMLACLDVLYQFFHMRSRFNEGMTWFKPAIDTYKQDDNRETQNGKLFLGKLLACFGGLAHYARENTLALESLEQARSIIEPMDQAEELAFCHSLLAGILLRKKEFVQAKAFALSNLEFYRDKQDAGGECRSLYLLGLIHNRLGKPEEAKRFLLEAVKTGQKLENRRLLMAPFNMLGDIFCIEGRYSEAEGLFVESLGIAREMDDLFHQAIILNNLASVYHVIQQYKTAEQSYMQSLDICRAIGDRDGEALAMTNLGELALAQGDHTRALEISKRALVIAQLIGEEWTIVACLNSLGEATCHLCQYDQAMVYLSEAIRIAWKVQAVDKAARSLVNVGRVFQLKGDLQIAIACYRSALAHSATEHEAREKAERWMRELHADVPGKIEDNALEQMLYRMKLI